MLSWWSASSTSLAAAMWLKVTVTNNTPICLLVIPQNIGLSEILQLIATGTVTIEAGVITPNRGKTAYLGEYHKRDQM
jgi:hypothetical protein